MATTTATITLNSSDLTGDALNLSTTTTLYKAGQTVGLENTTGMGRTTYAAAVTDTVLFADDSYADAGAHKLYIANKATDATHYIEIKVEAVTLGRLYAGDWMFIPWDADAGTDIKVTTAHAGVVIEYMAIFE